jgi:hypothetical protein
MTGAFYLGLNMFSKTPEGKEYHRRYRIEWKKKNPDYDKKYRAIQKKENPNYYKNQMIEFKKKNPDYYSNYRKEYKLKNPWITTYLSIKSRIHKSHNRKSYSKVKCYLTIPLLKELWFRDKAYLMETPCLHRLDNKGHYSFDNVKYVEKKEHDKYHGQFRDWHGRFIST